MEKVLHSKIKSNMWPSISVVLGKIHFFLPKTPEV